MIIFQFWKYCNIFCIVNFHSLILIPIKKHHSQFISNSAEFVETFRKSICFFLFSYQPTEKRPNYKFTIKQFSFRLNIWNCYKEFLLLIITFSIFFPHRHIYTFIHKHEYIRTISIPKRLRNFESIRTISHSQYIYTKQNHIKKWIFRR